MEQVQPRRKGLRDWVKTGVGLIVATGVGALVGTAVKSNHPDNMKLVTKFCVGVAGFVLTGLAADAAQKQVDDKVDMIFDTVDQIEDNVKDALNVPIEGEVVEGTGA